MSWIILAIGIWMASSFLLSLVICCVGFIKGNLFSITVSNWQLYIIVALLVLPFYVNHWPTYY